MEVRDPADERGARDELVAVHQQVLEESRVANIALDEAVARVVVIGFRDLPVLRVVVDTYDLVPAAKELIHHIAPDEPRRPGDKHSLDGHYEAARFLAWSCSSVSRGHSDHPESAC